MSFSSSPFQTLPSLSLKPAYLKVLPFLAFISPPPPLNLWSCSSRSAQSHNNITLFFLWRRRRDVRMGYTSCRPLVKTVNKGTTSAYLPKVPRQTTKLSKLRYGTFPRPILTNQLYLNFQANKQQFIFCSSQRVLACPHRTVHQQNLILSSRFQALPRSPSLAYCPSSSTLPLPHIQPNYSQLQPGSKELREGSLRSVAPA